MRGLHALGCSLMLLFVGGCVASPYSSETLRGGYSEKELRPGFWHVEFSGNGSTTRETVQTYWLYRCAEITLQNGYDDFEIISGMSLMSDRPGQKRDAKPIFIRGGSGGGFILIPMGPSNPLPSLEGDIRLLRHPFATRPPKSYDAAVLKARLEPLVKGKLCDSDNVCPHAHRYLFPDENAPAPPGGQNGI